MGRDHRKLRAFALADTLIPEIYRCTANFPAVEQYGRQAQLRRAAVSAACNLVEGSARQSEREYLNFVNIALGSAAEARYLIGVALHLGFLNTAEGEQLQDRYDALVRSLQKLLDSVRAQQPEAGSVVDGR